MIAEADLVDSSLQLLLTIAQQTELMQILGTDAFQNASIA